ncbi:sigma-54 interaction domain-containing protein [Desulfoluna butyratoxydans]|uniref:Bacterial regulatory protein fis family n=1 Tax=Desulfoluna butyratoxydans TaxID=231438 RepID=A0A4U8YNU0_9BACT|nr:sigma-54 dependent transcriptional regulator [Desulfoluna butyratoxydans]VFQ45304.1 bacterial regulatory protein fis family [Desulfoluna butyratoxydans]
MTVDKHQFFRNVTLSLCCSLDLEKALFKCFQYIRKYIPADGLQFDITEPNGATVSIVRVTKEGVEIQDILIPFSPESIEEEQRYFEKKENKKIDDVLIFNAPNINPISKDFAKVLNLKEASNLVLPVDFEDSFPATISLYSFSQHAYTADHAKLFSAVKEPFSMAMSNALRHRDVQNRSENFKKETQRLYLELMKISGDKIIGAESGLKEVMTLARHVAEVESPVMLLGETGTGKDVIANAIHQFSKRHEGPVVKVNCGAIPENLIDSELFGHEKGAFTGAVSQKRGKFERADSGTLFLDEVGELSLVAQVRLLRAIQFKEIERLGGTRTIPVDTRIIAATHRDMDELIKSGTFREDLYFRLNVFPIHIPPLRKRKEDIPALAHYFIEKKAKDLNLYPPQRLAPRAMDQLMDYDWPGNVRELSNIIERALILNRNTPLTFDHLHINSATRNASEIPRDKNDDDIIPFDDMISQYIVKVLKRTGGRIEGPNGAAKLLNMKPNTLRSKIKKLNIRFHRTKAQKPS